MTEKQRYLTDSSPIITTFFLCYLVKYPYLCTIKTETHHIMQLTTHFRRSLLSVLSFLIATLTSLPVLAQYSITEHILINEGLSNNFICDMTLDRKGRLWVATESGLNAYNGSQFISYNVSNSALTANMVNCLWYDNQADLLWVGTKGEGICSVQPDTGEVTVYDVEDSTLVNILDITPADNRRLWLICHNDIMLLNMDNGSIEHVNLGQISQHFRCGVDDGNGNLVIGSHMHGASVLNARTQQLTPLSLSQTATQRSNVNVNEIMKDHRGRIWVATNAGLWYYLPGSSQLLSFQALSDMEVFHIEEIDNQYLWITTRASNYRIDLENEQISPLHTEGEIALFSEIQSLYQDPYGNIWVGSSGNGIQFISHISPFFHKFFNEPVWGIYAEGDIVWVGSRDRIFAFQGTHCVRDVNLAAQGFANGIVLSINGNGSDLLYLAVPNHMLAFNKATGAISNITTADGQNVNAITFYREDDGTFWITTSEGVYNLQNGYAVPCQPINEVLHQQSFHGIRRDKQGKLWVATFENGLYLFDKDLKLIRNLSQQSGFFSNCIQHLKFDNHERLWMSTPDGPCCIPDTRHPDQFVTYGYEEGLHDTYIRAIQEDRNGNVWMSTNNGISMLENSSKTFVNYNQSDYLPFNNMNGGAIMLSDGALVFNSIDGLCLFYPDSLTTSREPAPFHLLSLQVLSSDDQGASLHPIMPDANGVYQLDPQQNSFRLSFGTSDYAQSRFIEYEYQLGTDKDNWIKCPRNVVTFRNLTPDNYKVRIRSRLKGQPWTNQNILITSINIHQPWWWSWWARCLYLLLIVTIITIFIRHYLHRIRLTTELDLERRKNLVEHEHSSERLQFFTNITHELKTPLTLIQAPLEELLQNNSLTPADQKRIRLVYDSSCRLTDLCNKLLEFRKSETHAQHLKVSLGDLGQLIQEIGQSFIELNTNPNLKILVDVNQPQHNVLFDADVIRSIITNLMSNALKYTPKGSIHLHQRQYMFGDKMFTEISVSDTGYGIPASSLPHIFDRYYQVSGPHQASGTGIGLSIVRSLAELHKAEIKVKSQEGSGTTFTLLLDGSQTYPDALHTQSQYIGQEEAEATANEALAEGDSRPLLLLVEDDYQILNFMSESLSTDYRILRAHNGQEGLDLALVHMPDIVITDLMMPVMNGNILCRTLKNDIRTSHIPVIMLTAKDTPEDQMAGFTDGADIYLTKPFSIMMLRARLQNILSARAHMMAWINAQGFQPQQASPIPAETSTSAENEEEPVPVLSSYDQNFLRDVKAFIIDHIEADNIRMEDVAQSLHISHSTLYRKIKALTGLSGAEFIRKTRVLHSAELLRNERCNVSEAAYRCGFSNLAYFRTSFKEVFGVTPSEYQKK